MADIGILAAVIFAYALVSRRLDRASITAPMVIVVAGMLLGPDVLGASDLELTSDTGLLIAEIALVLVLFADAARIDLGALRGGRSLPARLLGIGMPLTIGLGVVAAAVLLGQLEFWEAAIVAAVLAPTDAALGQAVVSSELVPQRIRQALNVESGLNDGLSIPFLYLFVGLAVAEADVTARSWLAFAAEQVGLGTLVGVAAGIVGGSLVKRAIQHRTITSTFEQLAMVALALGAWALASEVGGNGFIAAFTAGLATARITPECGKRILDFSEDEGQLLNLVVFFAFGVSAIGFLDAAGWEVVVYGLLSLTVIRMLPVAISLLGTGLRAGSVAFCAWFGPRGLASIILALVVVEEEPSLPALDVILATMTVTVLASVFAHGLSARPLVRRYSRSIRDAPPTAPEREPAVDMPVRGRLAEPMR
jgi:NhaP-type Na+/H+ or K+/H+ antiporter